MPITPPDGTARASPFPGQRSPHRPAEAEYPGRVFLRPQVAQLTLKVFRQSGEPRRRAMFSFGPEPTSPGVPRGAFIVEGSIDLQGGDDDADAGQVGVAARQGYNWLGLSGRSDDGGKTFSGTGDRQRRVHQLHAATRQRGDRHPLSVAR